MLNIKKTNHTHTESLVSVVIPVYNVEQYIEEALTSVLNQRYKNLEIIIVDDQSPDQSIELIKSNFDDPRIQIIEQKNRGLAGARNTGIHHAKGRYVAFLDSDDHWQDNKLEQHIAFMSQHPDYGVSFCSSMFIDEQSQPLGRLQQPKKKQNYKASDIFCRNPIGNGSVPVIQKKILDQIGFKSADKSHTQYFDESLKQSEDIDCWTRIAILTGTKFHYIDQPLTNYRLNSGGLSADVDKQFETWSALLNKLEGYAPLFAKEYGPIAKTFQYRYLARRCVFQAQGALAIKLMWRALKTRPLALCSEPLKTIETLLASVAMSLIPSSMQKRLLKKLL